MLSNSQLSVLSNYKFSDHISVSKKTYSSGHKLNIMTKEEYKSASMNQRLIFDSKIAVLGDNRTRLLGLESKTPEFFSSFLHNNLSGLSLHAAGFSTDMGQEVSQSIINNIIEAAAPDTTDEIKEAIIKSMFIAKDRKELESDIEENFKELISIKDTLGSFFGTFNKFLGLKNRIRFSDNSIVSYKDKFLERNNTRTPDLLSDVDKNIFESGDYYMKLVVPGVGTHIITNDQLNNFENMTSEKAPTQYAFIKFQSLRGQNIAPLNNGAIVRI